MKKILITISNNTLFFSYKSLNEENSKNLLNTNVIKNDEIYFSDLYMVENTKLVSSFIKEVAIDNKIRDIVLEDNDMATIIIPCLNKIPVINCIYFKENTNLTFKICELIINNLKIRGISCYAIPTFLIEMLDREDIIVESRCEVLFNSSLMSGNNLTSYSKIFYKMNLRIVVPIKNEDLDELEAFCKINKYLKNIHINKCDIETIDTVVKCLYKYRVKNINIYIHDNINDEKIVEALKKLNKKYTSKYKISLKLSYDEKYIKDNYLKQVTFTTLKVCSLLILAIIGGFLGYTILSNNLSAKKVDKINEEINILLSDVKDDNINSESTDGVSKDYLKSLLTMNSDTVGWLSVKNTKVDYPVVQTNDNDYYLKKNYNKQSDRNGWIFMDYRNNATELDKNTIIYGHNIYYSDIMFATLTNVTKSKWLEDEENHYITFNTLNENLQWKIFSVYSIKKTSDYLEKDFSNDEEWLEFVSMIKDRSDYKFDTEVNAEDKIVTLSTCLQNDRRLVVHAVLVKK
ncbi:MAG: class B sortase [Bacilli bacterium]